MEQAAGLGYMVAARPEIRRSRAFAPDDVVLLRRRLWGAVGKQRLAAWPPRVEIMDSSVACQVGCEMQSETVPVRCPECGQQAEIGLLQHTDEQGRIQRHELEFVSGCNHAPTEREVMAIWAAAHARTAT